MPLETTRHTHGTLRVAFKGFHGHSQKIWQPFIVGIDKRQKGSGAFLDATIAGCSGAGILLTNQMYARIRVALHDVRSVIRGAVVNNNDFTIVECLSTHRIQSPPDVSAFVVQRDDDAYLRHWTISLS